MSRTQRQVNAVLTAGRFPVVAVEPPPMHYPTHCLGPLTGVTRERIRRVSCLGWGGGRGHPSLDDNDYSNQFGINAR